MLAKHYYFYILKNIFSAVDHLDSPVPGGLRDKIQKPRDQSMEGAQTC